MDFQKAQQKAILEELEKQKQTNEYSFDSLTIESAKDAVVTIYSVSGQMLSQQNISEGISTIDLSNLNAGMYFISVNETMVKVVKQ